jgi:hypothetical protein
VRQFQSSCLQASSEFKPQMSLASSLEISLSRGSLSRLNPSWRHHGSGAGEVRDGLSVRGFLMHTLSWTSVLGLTAKVTPALGHGSRRRSVARQAGVRVACRCPPARQRHPSLEISQTRHLSDNTRFRCRPESGHVRSLPRRSSFPRIPPRRFCSMLPAHRASAECTSSFCQLLKRASPGNSSTVGLHSKQCRTARQ